MRHTIAVFLAIATVAVAHPGPRIWVSIDNGVVTTYAGAYPPGDPQNYHPATVFTQAMADIEDGIWETDFPGYQRVPGGTIPTGTTFRYNIVGPLLWYVTDDPARCPYFAPVADYFAMTPPVPQMAVTNELFQTKYTADGFVAGDATFAFNGGAGDHNHLTHTLLGDGVQPGGGPDGVYGLQLQLTAPGFTPSETYILLLGKSATPGELAEAADVLTHPRIATDADCDGDSDLDDFAFYRFCQSAAHESPGPFDLAKCPRADFDITETVDLLDFAALQRCFGWPDATVGPTCAP